MKRKVFPPASAWFVVDEDGWPIRGPFTMRRSAIDARKRVDTTRPLRVVAYDPRQRSANAITQKNDAR